MTAKMLFIHPYTRLLLYNLLTKDVKEQSVNSRQLRPVRSYLDIL